MGGNFYSGVEPTKFVLDGVVILVIPQLASWLDQGWVIIGPRKHLGKIFKYEKKLGNVQT